MKIIGLSIAGSAALALTACGGGQSSTNSSTYNEAGGANVNAGARGNSSIGAPGNQLRRGNTIVGSAPSDATDGDSMSNTTSPIQN